LAETAAATTADEKREMVGSAKKRQDFSTTFLCRGISRNGGAKMRQESDSPIVFLEKTNV
jgi:hypothetical protein